MGRAANAVAGGTDLVLRALAVQGIWLLGTLAGGVVFGWAPATLAAMDAADRASRGEKVTLRRAAGVWREEFWRSQIVLGPPVLLLLLGGAALGATGAPLLVKAPAVVGIVLLAAALLHVPQLELTYRLRPHQVLSRAALLALAQAPMTLLIAAALALWTGVLLAVPGLAPFVGLSVPILVVHHLVSRSLERNDRLLAAEPAPRGAPRKHPAPRPSRTGHPPLTTSS